MKKDDIKQILLKLAPTEIFEALFPFLKIVIHIQHSPARGLKSNESREVLKLKKLLGVPLNNWEAQHLRSHAPPNLTDLKEELKRLEDKEYKVRDDEIRMTELRGLILNAEAHGGRVLAIMKNNRPR